jgi:cell division protein FtsI/penicillin-binding protein 2
MQQDTQFLSKKRLLFAKVCIILIAGGIIFKLFNVQIKDYETYSLKAEKQYSNPNKTVFNRGTIYFTKKDGLLVSAATLQSGYTVAFNPKISKNPEDIYNVLSGLFPVAEDEFIEQSNKNDPYEILGKRIPEDSASQIKSMKLSGVSLSKERWRFYPLNKLASHIIGFYGYSGDKKTGLYGLEKYYNDILNRNEDTKYSNFFAELFLSIRDTLGAEGGSGDIVTSIEPVVSMELDKTLNNLETKFSTEIVGGIIMNPKTGEIYAMNAKPNFNPNEYGKEKKPSVFTNPLVEHVYELGSIMKPIAMASAIDAGVITRETTYDDTGVLSLDGSKIANFDGKARGVVDMQEVLNQSLNIGMAFVASRLGGQKLADYYRSFGFGEETGIDLPGEIRGLVDNLNSKRKIEFATAAYGQGIAVTPIEMVRALSALGNGGILPTPHIAKRIEFTSGASKDVSFKEGPQVITKETSKNITRMLVEVVDKALLGGTVKIDRYSVAAKTGTAQMARSDGKGYYTDRYLHSFFGYFPAYDPKFIVFLFAVNPKGVTYASHTLTEPFIGLTKFLINYYNIPPDR